MTLPLAQHLYHVEAASKHQINDDICYDIGMMMTKGKSDSKPLPLLLAMVLITFLRQIFGMLILRMTKI
jgi:hypothetical protein